jgi:hypothetical protein
MSGCKVERVEAEYGVPLDERLREAHEHGDALRELERQAGIELLREEVARAEVDFVEGDLRRYYNVLVDSESEVKCEQVRRKLSRAGVDVDQILESVPSYQTIRHHLQECADRDTSRHQSRDRDPEDVGDTVRGMQERMRRVIAKSARQMDCVPDVRDVHTSTLVTCDGCGETIGVHAFLDDGCSCGG